MPRLLRLFFVATLGSLAAVSGVVAPAHAQSTGDRQNQLKDEIAKLSQEQRVALASVRAIQDRKAVIDDEVSELDKQLSAAEATLAPLAEEAARIDTVVADLQARIDVTQRELDVGKAKLDVAAADMYRSARLSAATPFGVGGSADRLARSQKYLDRVSHEREDLIQQVTALRNDLSRAKQALHDQQVKADQARDQAKAARDQIASLRAQLEPARAEAAAQQAAEQAAVDDINARLGEDAALLASLQAASDNIAALLRAKPLPGKPGGCDVRPLNVPINSPYGPRGGSFHPGIDMAAPSGSPIRACRSGTVVVAGWQGGYGNTVVIDHGGNMATLYGHQSQIGVTVGDKVQAGHVIGFVGSTGQSTGPHLHFEVRLSGNVVDPEFYL